MSKRKITIRFSLDKNGKRRAHYWGLARRWLPISVEAAEFKLATGEADIPFIYTTVEYEDGSTYYQQRRNQMEPGKL